MSDSLLPALRGVFESKTLRRVLGSAAAAFGIWMGTWMRQRPSQDDLAQLEQRMERRVAEVAAAANVDEVDGRVKRTEEQVAVMQRNADALLNRVNETGKERRDAEIDLYVRLVSLQSADAEPNRALKAKAASDARRSFRMLVTSGGASPQRAAEIVLESPIPGYPQR